MFVNKYRIAFKSAAIAMSAVGHKSKITTVLLGMLLNLSVSSVNAEQVISLNDAIEKAQNNDPWLHGNKLKQSAIQLKSIAAGTLPDPKVSLSLLNTPTDTWDLDQEAMTQLKVGVSQMFPRGDSLAIKQSKLKVESHKFPLLREERKAKLKAQVSQLWLDAYLAQKTIELINNDKGLFEQMADVVKASYSTGVGKTRQQDVIRAQLELIQLEDRLSVQYQNFESLIAQLNEWLHSYDESDSNYAINFDEQAATFKVSNTLPVIRLNNAALLKELPFSRNKLAQALVNHPSLLVINLSQQAAKKDVDLANQQYKPQWGVNASYAYRDDMPSGIDRADLFSVGVTFDVPLFTENRQDKEVAASIAQSEAIKTDKLLLTKMMISNIEKEVRQLKRLSERQTLYSTQLITQTHEQAEAALSAYTNDDGGFSEVVRARITELNTKISALNIDIDALKTVTRINYFFTQSDIASETVNNSMSGE